MTMTINRSARAYSILLKVSGQCHTWIPRYGPANSDKALASEAIRIVVDKIESLVDEHVNPDEAAQRLWDEAGPEVQALFAQIRSEHEDSIISRFVRTVRSKVNG